MTRVATRAQLRLSVVSLLLALAVAIAGVLATARPVVAIGEGDLPIGLSRLLAAHSPTTVTRGIATFDAVPTGLQVTALSSLGLEVQPMKHVPLALVSGPVAAMESAVATGVARDVYPDEPIELFDTASSDAMGAASLRAAGLTGQGVTVGVVDSGCDASHPDLADHVVHNVKLYSAEYANIPPDSSNTIVVPVEEGPYQNTDLQHCRARGAIPASQGRARNRRGSGALRSDGTTWPS